MCTKNLTGCLSIVTFKTKSGGVPGFTVGIIIASWCECISVSSKSNTRIFFLTKPWKHQKSLFQSTHWIYTCSASDLAHLRYFHEIKWNVSLSLWRDTGERGYTSYLTDWCWATWNRNWYFVKYSMINISKISLKKMSCLYAKIKKFVIAQSIFSEGNIINRDRSQGGAGEALALS